MILNSRDQPGKLAMAYRLFSLLIATLEQIKAKKVKELKMMIGNYYADIASNLI